MPSKSSKLTSSPGPSVSAGRAEYESSVGANIENFVGTVQTPLGLAGPLVIHGQHAEGTFHVPMATTEGTLVASTSRGAKAINLSGGCHVTIVRQGTVQRAPSLLFSSPAKAEEFAALVREFPRSWFDEVVATKTTHGRFVSAVVSTLGSWVIIKLSLNPADAAGQNMVSVAAEAAVLRMLEELGGREKVGVLRLVMDGGLSGDKFATPMTSREGRGVAVTAWVDLQPDVLRKVCRVDDPSRLEEFNHLYAQAAASIGNSATHVSLVNVVAAIYLATGQDMASHAESCGNAQQFVTYNRESNLLRWEVCCSNLVMATVGGGTGLPTAKECLSSMGCYGAGGKLKLAEIVAATALANEVSFFSAIIAGDWVQAHASLKHRSKL